MSPKVILSPKQQDIVHIEDGPIYVKASAGSGKTRVLTERIRHLLGKTKRNILALTFTNKAGEEIKERLKDIPELKERLFIGTFHSFCEYVLENHGNLIGLSKMPHIFENEIDRLELIGQAIEQTPSYAKEYKELSKGEQIKFCYRVLKFTSQVKRKLISENDLFNSTNNENVVLLYQTYQDILRSQNAIDFDDLLLLTYNLFVNHPAVSSLYRRSYQYICIDEAQDLNNAQYQLLLALVNAEHKNIMMVGDPNQSIFAFSGSSSDFMAKKFVKKFSPMTIELNENYRSSKEVLAATKKIVPEAEDIANTILEGIFEIHGFEDEDVEAEWIIKKIEELIQLKDHNDIEGRITYEKIAVLGRSKYVFNRLESLLYEDGLPFYYKMTPGSIQFESDLMKIFDLAIRFKLNPLDTLHRNHLFKLLKITPIETTELQVVVSKLNKGIKKELLEVVIRLNEDGSNFKKEFEAFKDNIAIQDEDEDEDERRMILNDIEDLLKHWRNYATKTDNKSLTQFMNAMALGQTYPLAQQNGIALSTVHTMKGQEFDIVFLMGMDDETFPDYRAIKSGGIALTQENNDLYVAFTRAKRFLYVTWPKKRLMPWGGYKDRKISRFLGSFKNDQDNRK